MVCGGSVAHGGDAAEALVRRLEARAQQRGEQPRGRHRGALGCAGAIAVAIANGWAQVVGRWVLSARQGRFEREHVIGWSAAVVCGRISCGFILSGGMLEC